MKLNIPDYLNIKDYKYFNSLEHLSLSERMFSMILALTDIEEDTLRELKPTQVGTIYKKLLDELTDIENTFYPIFELDDVMYGYVPMSKLTLGEYSDLERLSKQPMDNLEQILAILYRPITKHRFNGIKWAFKNHLKIKLGDAENLFKYYEVEKYDASKRGEQAEKMAQLPAGTALGALSFFLLLVSTSSLSMNLSSQDQKQMIMEMSKKMASVNIGDGLELFLTSQTHPYYKSQEIRQSPKLTSSSVSPT